MGKVRQERRRLKPRESLVTKVLVFQMAGNLNHELTAVLERSWLSLAFQGATLWHLIAFGKLQPAWAII